MYLLSYSLTFGAPRRRRLLTFRTVKIRNIGGSFRIEAGLAVRTAPDPLSALRHAIGVVGIMIDFQAGTKVKRPWQLQKIIRLLIYQSLDYLATRALSRFVPKTLFPGVRLKPPVHRWLRDAGGSANDASTDFPIQNLPFCMFGLALLGGSSADRLAIEDPSLWIDERSTRLSGLCLVRAALSALWLIQQHRSESDNLERFAQNSALRRRLSAPYAMVYHGVPNDLPRI